MFLPVLFLQRALLLHRVKSYSCDVQKAKELLKEAGYADGMTLDLWMSNFQEQVNGATVIQSMLAQVGIKVNIQVFESGVFDEQVKKNTHDLIISRWGMQTNRDAGQYWLLFPFIEHWGYKLDSVERRNS